MSLLKRITSYRNLIYVFFIVLHVLLLNINAAEWGDSYRILRASEHLRNDFSYPSDEKRPPLYSFLLSIRPNFVDPVLWGRIFMLVTSVFFLFFFEKFLRLFIKNEKYVFIGMLLLIFNPVFLYWSLRIYADVFFSLIVLITFYLVTLFQQKYQHEISSSKFIFLGLLTGLAVLTRFEGYLLFGAVSLAILFWPLKQPIHLDFDIEIKDFILFLRTNYLKVVIFVLSFVAIILPWFIYRNPFVSSYFEEPSGRSYDYKMVWIYVSSLLFVFGSTSIFSFLFLSPKKLGILLRNQIGILFFLAFELFLILLWPAAIPRLFVPILPFLIVILSLSLQDYFENKFDKQEFNKLLSYHIVLLGIYVVSQYFLKLQFLIPTKNLFVLIVILQLVSLFLLFIKKYNLYALSILLSCIIWSGSVIYIHKDNYISIKNAAEYVSKNISGRIAYNDVSSVSDWYLNSSPSKNLNLSAYFYNFEKDKLLTEKSLNNQPLDYLLITNEHNLDMEIDLKKRPYLTLIKEFSYNVNGKVFNTRLVKLERK